MYYQLLRYFGFLPDYLETIILIAIAVIVVLYTIIVIFVKKMSFSLYFPAILLTVSHICERFLRLFESDIEAERASLSTFILVLLLGWAIKNLLNTSTMFAVSIGLIIFASGTHQNIMLFTFFVVLALILLIITLIKSINYHNVKQIVLCIIGIILDFIVLSVKLGYLLNLLVAILLLYWLISSKEPKLSKVKVAIYLAFFALIAYFYTPLIAIECILIIEQIIICIKAKNPISLIVIFLGSFFAFWLYGLIFMHEFAVVIFIIILLLLINYLSS